MTPALADLLDPWLHPGLKGWPADAPPTRASAVGSLGWHLLDGTLPLPLATLDNAALARNLGWMQRLVDRAGVGLAPHGKTTMSPQLFRAQLDAGAWGLTVASVQQLALAAAAGARRVLIANQVLQAADLRQLTALRRAHPGLWVGAWLDSAAQLQALEATPPQDGPLDVLLELGLAGGRTGLRDDDAALALARQARASTAVRLAGLACYEGLWSTGDDTADRALVQGLTDRLQALAQRMEHDDLFEAETVIVTAGGSAVFDLVAPALKLTLRRPVQGVLRSGCYLTHDDGFYQRMGHAANRRLGCADADGLQAALRVWARVQSVPEPGLAILNAGKRDLGTDMGLPRAVAWAAAGGRSVVEAPAGWEVTGLNDQHAYLRLAAGAATPAVGDVVGLGISHPCTTFDKWRWMARVDVGLGVVGAVTTEF